MTSHIEKAEESLSKPILSPHDLKVAQTHALVSIAESLDLLIGQLSDMTQYDHDSGTSLRVLATVPDQDDEDLDDPPL